MALEHSRLVEELRRANRLKSDFLATMSHELRTPLNVIMGYNDLLLGEDFGPLGPEQAETLQRSQKSAEDLLSLINATLDVGRLEARQFPLDLEQVDLQALLEDTIVKETSRHEKSAVVLDVPPELPPLETDRAKLKIVIRNLLANALKFTPPEGRITVSIQDRAGEVEITVADTGIGIAPDVLPIIFEPFTQGENPMTRRFGGVGLGLYIVRRIIDLLGGTVTVESEVGRGSTFRVRLPVQQGSSLQGCPSPGDVAA
jgi:signal transduction histidine kinase